MIFRLELGEEQYFDFGTSSTFEQCDYVHCLEQDDNINNDINWPNFLRRKAKKDKEEVIVFYDV